MNNEEDLIYYDLDENMESYHDFNLLDILDIFEGEITDENEALLSALVKN